MTNPVKKYSLFIFDFDGTLSDSRLNIANSFNAALTTLRFERVDNLKIYPLIGKINLEQTFKHFYPDLSKSDIESLITEFRAYQILHAKAEITLYPQVVETLKTLKEQGKTLCILTTKGIRSLETIVKELQLDSFFEVLYGNGSGFGEKPEGSTILHILTQTKIHYEKIDTVMVGDTDTDILTAKNAGIDMIGVGWGTDGSELLSKNGATYVINSFDQLLNFSEPTL